MSEIETSTCVEDSNQESRTEEETMKSEQEESGNGIKDAEKDESEPSSKKPRLAKDNTMLETAKNAKDFLGKEKLDELRSSTRAVRESKAAMKRAGTMAKTAKEGEALLKEMGHKDENPESERRRTRSQTRGTPVITPQKTPRQESAKRSSRRGRPRKEEKIETEEEKEESKSEDMNSAEEEKAIPDENAADGPDKEEEEETQPENDNEPEEKKAD